ncbi:FtsX-like permease family protein [Lentilactobacillus sp. TOM.63]|uniref:FtsX-like permease family protein n=1 Tax=Lentilactobacillus sp. TOM.63 TaxID=3055077 RepID=UPI0025A22D3A|nr:FtsX-like permease family protein [Lentilactobacillus sp. TOM.63]MDM7516692.1 FtsX-like permease family protein [Lentilactobacillus sp. TOM.63]
MLFKISLSGVKSRWKDYLVLFSGMMITTAIFYMFEAISTNDKFTTSSPVGQNAKFVFIFGSILLAIITLVYVFYANNFLMSMRKHNYGLFMMLGAKSKVISKLIILETLVIGLASTFVGIILGVGFTKRLSGLLSSQIHVSLTNFSAFYMPAVWATLILFLVLFVIAGLVNARTFTKTSALNLLRSNQESDWKDPKKRTLFVQAVGGLVLLAIGYYAMYDINHLQLLAIGIGLITIVLGTYFVFNSFFVMILEAVQRSNTSYKGLNNFTISQLKFRIRDYTKILSVVSLLFALALGAITVGIGFQRMVPMMAAGNNAYAVGLTNPSPKMKSLVGDIDGKAQVTYQQKVDPGSKSVYYRASQFEAQPFKYAHFTNQAQLKSKIDNASLTQLKDRASTAYAGLNNLQAPLTRNLRIRLVSDTTFNRINAKANTLLLVRVNDMDAAATTLSKITNLQTRQYGKKVSEGLGVGGAYETYQLLKGVFGSLEFMGIFLGIAFLAMLASCLMFKILSGAASDKARFEMLNKIGARKSVLNRSIAVQILGLFILPAVLGIIDVAFGLQMFIKANLLHGAYQTFGWSALGFSILYLIYYGITVMIYSKIVVPKTKVEK